MKKQSPEAKARTIRLSNKRRRSVLFRKGKFVFDWGNYHLRPPQIMSFSRNYRETVQFFERFKREHTKRRKKRRETDRQVKPLKINLSGIVEISIPAAVVLAAELDRWRMADGIKLHAMRMNEWSPRLKSIMMDLGVFDLLKVKVNRYQAKASYSDITLVTLKSDTRADGDNVKELMEVTKQMIENFSSKPALYTAISEAIQNSVEHAYPEDIELEFATPGTRWWATVSYDVVTQCLRFFVYDQGVGIARTIPTSNYYEGFRKFLADRSGGLLNSEAFMLEAAMEYGRSGTTLTNRGKGLAKMAAIIDEAGEGKIRIISGKAQVTYEALNLVKMEHPTHVGGTLIEWSIPLSVFDREKGD